MKVNFYSGYPSNKPIYSFHYDSDDNRIPMLGEIVTINGRTYIVANIINNYRRPYVDAVFSVTNIYLKELDEQTLNIIMSHV